MGAEEGVNIPSQLVVVPPSIKRSAFANHKLDSLLASGNAGTKARAAYSQKGRWRALAFFGAGTL